MHMKSSVSQLVLDFHNSMGQPAYSFPHIPNIDRAWLRARLIDEEAQETLIALAKGDIIEIADGLCDLLYVLMGTAWEYGLGGFFGELFEEVHRSNMSKLDPVTGKPNLREDGKVIKPDSYSKADLKPIIQKWIAASQGTSNVNL